MSTPLGVLPGFSSSSRGPRGRRPSTVSRFLPIRLSSAALPLPFPWELARASSAKRLAAGARTANPDGGLENFEAFDNWPLARLEASIATRYPPRQGAAPGHP